MAGAGGFAEIESSIVVTFSVAAKRLGPSGMYYLRAAFPRYAAA